MALFGQSSQSLTLSHCFVLFVIVIAGEIVKRDREISYPVASSFRFSSFVCFKTLSVVWPEIVLLCCFCSTSVTRTVFSGYILLRLELNIVF